MLTFLRYWAVFCSNLPTMQDFVENAIVLIILYGDWAGADICLKILCKSVFRTLFLIQENSTALSSTCLEGGRNKSLSKGNWLRSSWAWFKTSYHGSHFSGAGEYSVSLGLDKPELWIWFECHSLKRNKLFPCMSSKWQEEPKQNI